MRVKGAVEQGKKRKLQKKILIYSSPDAFICVFKKWTTWENRSWREQESGWNNMNSVIMGVWEMCVWGRSLTANVRQQHNTGNHHFYASIMDVWENNRFHPFISVSTLRLSRHFHRSSSPKRPLCFLGLAWQLFPPQNFIRYVSVCCCKKSKGRKFSSWRWW